jgi:dsRNA-specific ribonuclease
MCLDKNDFSHKNDFSISFANLTKPLADIFEALIGAMFLDSGESFEPIIHFIEKIGLIKN